MQARAAMTGPGVAPLGHQTSASTIAPAARLATQLPSTTPLPVVSSFTHGRLSRLYFVRQALAQQPNTHEFEAFGFLESW